MVCDASEASLFAKDNSDTRQLLSALQVHRIIFKDIKNKYEDQQVTKLQRKFSNRKVRLNQIGLKETRQNNKLLQ